MRASIPVGGFPGQAVNYVLATVFRDGRASQPAGAPGDYRVRFTLTRPDAGNPDPSNVDATPDLIGDSLILMPKEGNLKDGGPFSHLLIVQNTPEGRVVFDGLPNAQGRLGLLACTVSALGHKDAARKAYSAVASVMSSWSAQLDIPVQVERVLTEEVATYSYSISHRNPFPDLPLAIEPAGQLPEEFRGFAGVYREALNSNSPAYEFLCLFKIIEAVQERRARRISDGTAQKGRSFPFEKIPEDKKMIPAYLNAVFYPGRKWDDLAVDSIWSVETAGQRFYHLIEKHLLPLRVAIAHTLVEHGAITLSMDEMLHLGQVEKWLPVAKLMARRMLKNEFPAEFLSFLGEHGEVRFDELRSDQALRVATEVRPPPRPPED